MSPRRPLIAVLVALAVSALDAASASAVGWVTGPPVSPPGVVATTPMIAVTPSGGRIVAWVPLQPGTTSVQGIAVRQAPPGGDFGATQLIAGGVDQPTLKVGSDGTAVLAWLAPISAHDEALHIARRTPGQSTFTQAAPFPLGKVADQTPAIAIENGAVYVAVGTSDEVGTIDSSAIRVIQLAAGSTTPVALDGGPDGMDHDSFDFTKGPGRVVEGARIAIQGDRLWVMWEHLVDGTGNANGVTSVFDATRPLGGGTFTRGLIDAVDSGRQGASLVGPRLVTGGGRLDAIWMRQIPGEFVDLSLSGGGPPRSVPITDFEGSLLAGLGPDGTLLLAGQDSRPPTGDIAVFGAVVGPGETTGTTTQLTGSNAERQLTDMAVASDGSALVLVDRGDEDAFDNADENVQASYRTPGGGFGQLEDVSGLRDRTGKAIFDLAAAAVGPGGRAFVAWSADDGSGTTNERIYVSQRDATPPVIRSVTLPARAPVGTTVRMSVNATDALSSVQATWDFGDHSGASGRSVGRVYGAPGRYTVTVTVRDGAGNATTQRRTLVITPAPVLVTRVGLTSTRFRVGRRSTALLAAARRVAVGTVLKLRVNQRATVVVSISHRHSGHRPAVTIGTLIRAGRGPGEVSIPFSGRVGRTRLAPGPYIASVTGIVAGEPRSQLHATAFTVVGR
jgi:PKD domain